MALPTAARTWSPGEVPTAAHFNNDIRDAINFHKRPPACILKHASNVVISNNTWTALSWTDTEPVKTESGMHSTSSNTSRLIATVAGWYFLFAHIRWEWFIDNTGARAVNIRRNAAGAIGSGQQCAANWKHSNNFSSDRHGQSVSGFQAMSVNDYLECFVWHDYQNFLGPQSCSVYHNDTTTPVRFGMVWAGT